tara:strand:+ start:2335 stop:3312 length:978 start_codon:yes stop_codon:yes gene_type:complete
MSNSSKKENLPWIEKYRPKTIDDIMSHKNIKKTLTKFVNDKYLPHLLFHGPSGTGKTSTINACAKEIFGKYKDIMVMELNASDDRGIEVVRTKIKQFVSSSNNFYGETDEEKNSIFKLVILDEADAMTDEAQAILRQVVEKYTYNARFCLICNYIKKINPALQSRCTLFRFMPLDNKSIKQKIKDISKTENITITKDGISTIQKRSMGDMRKALNILQSVQMVYDEVNEHNINKCAGYPQKTVIEDIYKSLINDSFINSYNKICSIKETYGISLIDIVNEIHDLIIENETYTTKILIKLKDIEYNMITTSTDNIQIPAFIGIFKL